PPTGIPTEPRRLPPAGTGRYTEGYGEPPGGSPSADGVGGQEARPAGLPGGMGERPAVEHRRHRVPRPQHRRADRAAFDVGTFGAGHELRPAGAADGGQRAVDDADDVAEGDVPRRLRQAVAAVPAAAAF